MDRFDLSADIVRKYSPPGISDLCSTSFPSADRPVRKRIPAARHHSNRPDVPFVRNHRGLDHGDNNLFTQIGFFVLIGLACKNAILIAEFARELEIQGKTTYEAAIEAAYLRLRPILMTSIAFIMGVLPLVLSHGAGAEMRHAMGVAVFFGMIG